MKMGSFQNWVRQWKNHWRFVHLYCNFVAFSDACG